jgi:hypothetical protein
MRRISTSTRVVDKFGAGKDGFTNGDPVGGIPSTDLEDVWFDHVQEEIATVIESAGMALDPSNRGQLLAALFRLTVQHGQCRLSKSGANLLLSPVNGNKLVIGGVMRTIPAAGVSLAPTGLTAATTHYVYAFMNGAAMTLEASTTGHSTDSTTGVEIKTGDASRTLVGMAHVIAGPSFADTAKTRLVRSWFNDPGIAGAAYFTASRSTTSTASYVELGTDIRNEFLIWAGEICQCTSSGMSTASAADRINSVAAGFDGVSNLEVGSYCAGYGAIGASGIGIPYAFSFPKAGLSEGYHFATLAGKVSAGTGTWSGGTLSPGLVDACAMTIYIKK